MEKEPVRSHNKDILVLRGLAKQYAEIAAKPVQDERRRLWSDHFSFKSTRPPIRAEFGMWNYWCQDYFSDRVMQCRDPFYRALSMTTRLSNHGSPSLPR